MVHFSDLKEYLTVKIKFAGIILGCLCLLAASSWSAASGRIHYSKLYKPSTVKTTRGEIVSLGKTISGNGKRYCETLRLKTKEGTFWVVLKPVKFRPKTNLTLQTRDQVEVTGSYVALPGKTAIIAATVKKGNDIMVLRDQTGRPAWL
jgi:hypothetical protein